MRIIPVIDVMYGQVVRAVGGRRGEYRPWTGSKLTSSTDPVAVARAMLDATEASELYVADLDCVSNPMRGANSVRELAGAVPDAQIWADVGIRTACDITSFPRKTNLRPIIGTETVALPDVWVPVRQLFQSYAVSVDLSNGLWLGSPVPWAKWGIDGESPAIDLIAAAVRAHADRVIVLDLAHVGGGRGTGTEMLVTEAKELFPSLLIFAGGGVRDCDDLRRLEDAGADGVLVASALHEGRLL